jgi:hypothetical protein
VAVETRGRGRIAWSVRGVDVAGGFLDIAQRDAGVDGGGDERVAKHVGPTRLLSPARRAMRRTIRAATVIAVITMAASRGSST